MSRVVIADNKGELDVHVGYIRDQVERSIEEGGGRNLAVKIVSGSYDWVYDPRTQDSVQVVQQWGRSFLAPPGGACAPRDEQCEIERIWDFMVLNVRYVFDPPAVDTFATLKETLFAGGGDCDDATIAFATLLGSIGFHVIGRVISEKGAPNQWVHIYPMVGLPKEDPREWMPLDATVEGATPGWEYPNIARRKDYLLV